MTVGGVYILPTIITCPYIPCRGVYTLGDECWRAIHPSSIHRVTLYPLSRGLYPGDEYWRDVHPSNIHRVPVHPLSRGLYPSRQILEGCTSFQYSLLAPITLVTGSIPLKKNDGGVYNLPIFIACPYTLCLGLYTPRDECWRDVHPSNIHPVALYPLSRGLSPLRCIVHGCGPFQYSSRAPIPPVSGSIPLTINVAGCRPFQYSSRALVPRVKRSIPLAMDVGGVYTVPIFISCPYTPRQGVYTPRAECWRSVHPFNIHCVSLYPLSRVPYPSR